MNVCPINSSNNINNKPQVSFGAKRIPSGKVFSDWAVELVGEKVILPKSEFETWLSSHLSAFYKRRDGEQGFWGSLFKSASSADRDAALRKADILELKAHIEKGTPFEKVSSNVDDRAYYFQYSSNVDYDNQKGKGTSWTGSTTESGQYLSSYTGIDN